MRRRSQPASLRGRPASSGASSRPLSIVPTRVRTMWRRNESAVISNATTSSSSSTQRADSIVADEDAVLRLRRREGAEVVPARRARGIRVQRVEVERPGPPERTLGLERRALAPPPDAVAIRARPRVETGVEAVGRLLGATIAMSSGSTVLIAGRRARAAARRRRRRRRRSRARARRCRCGRRRRAPRPSRRAAERARAPRPPPSARRAGAPSRGRRCRRTRPLASGARQALLRLLVRNA